MNTIKLLTSIILLASCLNITAAENKHIDAAMKVYEVAMKDFTEVQGEQYAVAIAPQGTKEEQKKIADKFLEVMRSKEFALKYSEVISKFFTEEECLKLAEILKDPVLAKFRKNKLAYTQEVMLIAQEMLLSKLSSES